MNEEATRNESLTIGATAQTVFRREGSGELLELVLRNSSTGGQTISLTFSDQQVAVDKQGIVLAAGQAYVASRDENYRVWQGSITAIADGAGAVLSVTSRTVFENGQ